MLPRCLGCRIGTSFEHLSSCSQGGLATWHRPPASCPGCQGERPKEVTPGKLRGRVWAGPFIIQKEQGLPRRNRGSLCAGKALEVGGFPEDKMLSGL